LQLPAEALFSIDELTNLRIYGLELVISIRQINSSIRQFVNFPICLDGAR